MPDRELKARGEKWLEELSGLSLTRSLMTADPDAYSPTDWREHLKQEKRLLTEAADLLIHALPLD